MMRTFAVMLLGGLGWLMGTASDATACSACAEWFAARKSVRGVLRPHVERSPGVVANNWGGTAPGWKLVVDGRTYYLNFAGNKKLAEFAAKLNGKEIEVVGREFKWRVVPTVGADEKGRSFTIAPLPPFDVDGLRVFELRVAR